MSENRVCANCKRNVHDHDTWKDSGTDAGCPYVVNPGEKWPRQCKCTVVVPSTRRPNPQHCQTCTCARLS